MKVVAVILILLLVAVGGTGCFVYNEAKGFLESKAEVRDGEAIVEIPRGASMQAVSNLLFDRRVVSNPRYFYYYLRYLVRYEKRGEIKSGEYQFKSGVTPREVADKIFRGDIYKHKVTVPEGLRCDEIAGIFSEAKLADGAQFLKLCSDAAFSKALGIAGDTLEGYLFPDTYLIARGLPVEQVVRMLYRRFQEVVGQYAIKMSEHGLSLHEAVTLASIIEKETGAPQERPLIAAVFFNRMRKKMRLQTDPTVIYGIIKTKGTFNGNLTRRDLETPTPYNTYTIPGLPPGPICSPGGEALKAVAHPAESNALFFVSRNDGTHVFCADYACHLKNVDKWQVEYFRKKH